MFEKQVKKMNLWDVALLKVSIAAFVLFVITIWPLAMDWVHSVSPWYFLIISLVTVVIVQFRIWR